MADKGYGDFTAEELAAEKAEIQETFVSLRFAQKMRHMSLSCFKTCGGSITYPFQVDPNKLVGKSHHCFSDCMNINLEKGPFLNELGEVPEDAVPKKFIWPTGLVPTVE